MQNIQGNTFRCDVGETVTMNFDPSNKGILRILFRDSPGNNFVDVGNDFQLDRTIGNQQVNIEILYVFFPGAQGNCRITLSGSNGGNFDNPPPAKDHPGLPEHRTYRFIPHN